MFDKSAEGAGEIDISDFLFQGSIHRDKKQMADENQKTGRQLSTLTAAV